MRAIKVPPPRKTPTRVDITVRLDFRIPGEPRTRGTMARVVVLLKVLAATANIVVAIATGGSSIEDIIYRLAGLLFGHGG